MEYRFQKYEYNFDLKLFEPILFKTNMTYNQIIETYSGGVANDSQLLDLNYKLLQVKFGTCDIIIPMKSVPELIVKEVLNPFYLFQIFSFCWWFWELYYYFAGCLVVLSMIALIVALKETITNL